MLGAVVQHTNNGMVLSTHGELRQMVLLAWAINIVISAVCAHVYSLSLHKAAFQTEMCFALQVATGGYLLC